MTTPSDWGFGIPRATKPLPEPIIGNADLAEIYEEEGERMLARIHRLTPKRALTALVYLDVLEPEISERVLAFVDVYHDKKG